MADTPVRGPGRYGWVVLAVVWLCGFVAPLNMVKVTALSPVLMASFGIDEALMGTIMSVSYTHLDVYKRQPMERPSSRRSRLSL